MYVAEFEDFKFEVDINYDYTEKDDLMDFFFWYVGNNDYYDEETFTGEISDIVFMSEVPDGFAFLTQTMQEACGCEHPSALLEDELQIIEYLENNEVYYLMIYRKEYGTVEWHSGEIKEISRWVSIESCGCILGMDRVVEICQEIKAKIKETDFEYHG